MTNNTVHTETKQLDHKVAFDFIRYANCWEDADILLEGLQVTEGQKVLSVGSAGDNSLSLLTAAPGLLVAVDINPSQLFLVELKKACFQYLNRSSTLVLLGFVPSSGRWDMYRSLAGHLSRECRYFWDHNRESLEAGVIHQGKFERYFRFFVRRILPFIHSQRTVQALLAPKSGKEQELFYETTWNSFRWKALFKIFFSRFVMGRFGRDPEFLKEVEVPVARFIFGQAERQLRSVEAQRNFMLRYNLTGDFGTLLPHYLQEENYGKIKDNIHALQLEQGYAQGALKKYGRMDKMNLSNIFEYMDRETFRETGRQLVDGLHSGGRVAYWNLMVPRMLSSILPAELRCLDELSRALTAKDKGFFYQRFITDQKQ